MAYPKLEPKQKIDILEAIEEIKSLLGERMKDLNPEYFKVDAVRRKINGFLDNMKRQLEAEDWDAFDQTRDDLAMEWDEIFLDGDMEFYDQLDNMDVAHPEWDE